jgi:hypothetical protein
MDYLDKECTKLLILFLSDEGRRVLRCATELHCHINDAEVTAAPFHQTLVILVKTAAGLWMPCVFALLPDQERRTYSRLMDILKELLVNFPQPAGGSLKIFVDYEEPALSSVLSEAFPAAQVRLLNAHQSVRISDSDLNISDTSDLL